MTSGGYSTQLVAVADKFIYSQKVCHNQTGTVGRVDYGTDLAMADFLAMSSAKHFPRGDGANLLSAVKSSRDFKLSKLKAQKAKFLRACKCVKDVGSCESLSADGCLVT